MVGVAGKSKACSNCRRRRVKCDFQQPFCSRCAKAKITCTGYSKDLVFVNRTAAKSTVTAATVLSELRSHKSLDQDIHGLNSEIDSHLQTSELLSPSDSPGELRTRAVHLIKQLYLPREYASNDNSSQTCHAWLTSILDLKGYSQALDISLLSFSMTLLYVNGSISSSLEKSLDLYNTALQKLRADVEHPKSKFREETVAAIVLVSMTELFLNTVDNGWRAHARGISEILKLRGPPTAVNSVWHKLCSRLQTICVIDALTKKHSLLLSPQEWRKFLSTDTNGSLGVFDDLIHTTSETLALLEETESFLTYPYTPELSARSTPLLERYTCATGKLYSWQMRVRSASDKPLYWAKTSTLSHTNEDENTENAFPIVLEFQSLDIAVPFVFSWSALLQIHCSLIRIFELLQSRYSDVANLGESQQHSYNSPSQIRENLSPTPPPTSWPSLSSSIEEANRLSRLICQSLEYSHNLDMGMLGPQATTYPQWVVRRYFRFHPGHEREFRWCCEFKNMRGPRHRSGVEMMMFTESILGEPYPPS